MKTYVLQFRRRDEFESAFLGDLPQGGVFIPTANNHDLDDHIQVYVCIPSIPEGVPLRGTVIWRRAPTKWQSALQPGIGVAFSEHEHARLAFLLEVMSGETTPRRNRSRRVPADFRVDFHADNGWLQGKALNVSRGGLFILTETLLEPKTPLDMKIFLEGPAMPDLYMGHVAWLCGKRPEMGLGVEFKFRSPIQRQNIYDFVEREEERLVKLVPRLARSTMRFDRLR
ncbi:MAG: PilZ domain-containing protein [Deltaproteobacteria bacterium]|jgi:Tfp pilus assembly protein PilZ|nr:PilZ domain-containing protein [Deltaproteobacteria bacterium]